MAYWAGLSGPSADQAQHVRARQDVMLPINDPISMKISCEIISKPRHVGIVMLYSDRASCNFI